MEIRFHGHATFELVDGETSVLIDPFLTGNPKAVVALMPLAAPSASWVAAGVGIAAGLLLGWLLTRIHH